MKKGQNISARTGTMRMQKRIEFINALITENSQTVTNTTRQTMEEGDKLYTLFKRQLQKTKEVVS